jgi:hypothetical protein
MAGWQIRAYERLLTSFLQRPINQDCALPTSCMYAGCCWSRQARSWMPEYSLACGPPAAAAARSVGFRRIAST